jgi:RHS repeat-associated protein
LWNSNEGWYLYGPGGQLLTKSGIPSTDYVYFAGRLQFTMSEGSFDPRLTKLTRVYSDRLGSTRATWVATYGGGSTTRNYYPFGEEIGSTASNTYKFASTYRDSATGLDYAINRYYASGMGRFLSVDPGKNKITAPQSFNRYSYAGGDPVNGLDPKGLSVWSRIGGIIGAILGDDDSGEEEEASSDPDWSGFLGNGASPGSYGTGGTVAPAASVIGGKRRQKMLDQEAKMIAKQDCGEFVTSSLQAAFLLAAGTSLENLGSQRSVYESLGVNSVNTALSNATFYNGGSSPTSTTSGGQTVITNATANYAAGSATFYSGFFDQDGTGRAQSIIHEGMHLVLGFSDRQFAQVWGVYKEGMTTQEASTAWNGVLKQHCK